MKPKIKQISLGSVSAPDASGRRVPPDWDRPRQLKAPSQQVLERLVSPEDSHVPLYLQIAEQFRGLIARGELMPGARLPTEEELITRFDLSRITVRKALGMLVEDGILVRRQGKGTFVASPPKVQHNLGRWMSMDDVLRSGGINAHVEVSIPELARVPDSVAKTLQLAPGSKGIKLFRRQIADGQPIAVVEVWLHPRFESIMSDHRLREKPVYTVLRDNGIAVLSTRQIISAVGAPSRVAKALSVTPGTPVLTVHNAGLDESGGAVDSTTSYFNPSLYVLVVELSGTGDGINVVPAATAVAG